MQKKKVVFPSFLFLLVVAFIITKLKKDNNSDDKKFRSSKQIYDSLIIQLDSETYRSNKISPIHSADYVEPIKKQKDKIILCNAIKSNGKSCNKLTEKNNTKCNRHKY